MRTTIILALAAFLAALGLALGAYGVAKAAPKQDYATVICRGNGDGGYRHCRVDFERPAKKVVVDVYIGGTFDVGYIWRPEVRRGEE